MSIGLALAVLAVAGFWVYMFGGVGESFRDRLLGAVMFTLAIGAWVALKVWL
jgi:hypothetical protein